MTAAAAMAMVVLISSAGSAASDTPLASALFPAELCPAVHIHGDVHDPSGARYDAKTGVWHLLLDAGAGGGVGHAWSKDLVHWVADPTYPWDTMADVPEVTFDTTKKCLKNLFFTSYTDTNVTRVTRYRCLGMYHVVIARFFILFGVSIPFH